MRSPDTYTMDVLAMQFDGENARDICDWVNENESSFRQKARNGGNWLKIGRVTVKKGDFVYFQEVLDTSEYLVMDAKSFRLQFTKKKGIRYANRSYSGNG